MAAHLHASRTVLHARLEGPPDDSASSASSGARRAEQRLLMSLAARIVC